MCVPRGAHVLQVRQHPGNAQAWRLLGTVHAENDDDRQVCAGLLKFVLHQAAVSLSVTSSLHACEVSWVCCASLDTRVCCRLCVVLCCCFPLFPLQAIAALNKALGADPANLEVLLSLGVSHTNELDAGK